MRTSSVRKPLASYCSEDDYAAVNAGRFWSRVAIGVGCWEWQRGRVGGYGVITWMGREIKAHRVAWRLTNGPIPEGMEIRHECDNPPCCNPAHLKLGTHTDNMRDISARGYHPNAIKTHCPKGHEYTTANTYRYGNRRTCKTCNLASSRKRHLKEVEDDS